MGQHQFDKNEPALLKAFHEKDPTALDQLYKQHFEALRRFAQQRVHDPIVAFAIASDSFVKLWERTGNFSHLTGIRAFLYVTTSNGCNDHWRDHANRQKKHDGYVRYHAGEEQPNVFQALLDHPRLQALLATLRASLPVRTRQVWDCVYSEGLNNEQIAKRMGVHVRTVQRERALIHTLVKSAPFQKQVRAIRREIDP